ncbi:Lysine 5,6-aminomutase alpha subunit [Streptomyces sp. enrichment culture]|uniref:lysine 5,6-aminomutase subunit alpha n=1 Tax=Streptomyces sp. enrichment culture TaxID=1795815 RepID=UPI003F56C20D
MRSKLGLDAALVTSCREAATAIAREAGERTAGLTTTSVERAVARLLGVDGVDGDGVPLPNVLVEKVHDQGELGRGLAYWLGNAVIATGAEPAEIARRVGAGELDLCALPRADLARIEVTIAEHAGRALERIEAARAERNALRARLGGRQAPYPEIYVLTATGNVYEDVAHAEAVAENGGDIVAVIRSTAQSLLDYVPYGPTTEGYGGTFATQANFAIMREALDRWSAANGRYVKLSSFCSGLCMPEFAVMGAIEGLDNMVNDALYGILYRDINPLRTMIDQRFSRRINGHFGIVINTGEDNYLRTSDAVEAAPAVVASQFINYQLARDSGVPPTQIAVGNAFEIHPEVTNGFLYEWAQAQLTRELFPDCPVKYMPPTVHMNGNHLRTQAVDSMFNLVTIATGQGIQTVGVPTEGIFTPHIHDRVHGLENVHYVFNFARDLAEEIEFRPDGVIRTRARDVLAEAHRMLVEVADNSLFTAIEKGFFGNVSRRIDQGRGAEGIVAFHPEYVNPFVALMEDESDG